MLGFSGTAHATQGDFTINGTITLGFVSTTISGSGSGAVAPTTQTTTTAGSWNGSWTATGTAPPCFVIGISANDTLAWTSGTPGTATEDLSNTVITIDSTGCTDPPQGVCVLTLNSTKRLTSNSFPYNAGTKTRTGTFTAPAGTQVGNYIVSEGTDCFTSGLAQQIAGALGYVGTVVPVGTHPTWTFAATSSSTLSVSVVKTLQTAI